jgi:arylsulfatase A-like enzyme
MNQIPIHLNKMNEKPNILIMLPHDLGDFLGCYGHPSVQTPHLDAMAARGAQLRNCFATSPECTPSRGSLLTGLYPHQNGLMGLSNFGWSLKVPHLAGRMRDEGYVTHLFGIQHETHDPVESLGYQHVHKAESVKSPHVCKSLCSFLQESSDDTAPPWFAHAGFFDPHRTWCALSDSRFSPDEIEVPPWLPDRPVVRKDLARYHEEIAVMDEAVGTVLDTLKETGRDRDTLVLFITDHGAPFPGAKATLYDPGLRISAILHWPGGIEGGKVYDDLISGTDIVPTILQCIGAEVPDGLAGQSFLPRLRGEACDSREEVAGGLFYDVAYDPMHYVRTKTHKYIRSFAVTPEDATNADPRTLSTFEAGRWVRVDDMDVLCSPTWQALSEEADRSKPPREELYDLRPDPCERVNLVDDPNSREVLEAMRGRLDRMMRQTDSPLRSGHVPPPPAQVEAFIKHKPHSPRFVESVNQRKERLS